MSKTRVVHVNDNVPGAVYIGRENGRKRLKRSRWHNPYVIGKPASHWIQADPITREGAIAAYALDMLDGPKQYLLAELPELRADDQRQQWTGQPLSRRLARAHAQHAYR